MDPQRHLQLPRTLLSRTQFLFAKPCRRKTWRPIEKLYSLRQHLTVLHSLLHSLQQNLPVLHSLMLSLRQQREVLQSLPHCPCVSCLRGAHSSGHGRLSSSKPRLNITSISTKDKKKMARCSPASSFRRTTRLSTAWASCGGARTTTASSSQLRKSSVTV